MKDKDGGPAFPQTMVDHPRGLTCGADGYGYGGMTLRDWFAGQALVGLSRLDYGPEECARRAKLHANALLAELEK